jgi:hypothetical protein
MSYFFTSALVPKKMVPRNFQEDHVALAFLMQFKSSFFSIHLSLELN